MIETKRSMNSARVKQLIDAYGASPEQWPADERAVAVTLLAGSSELQAAQQSAAQLDRYLEIDKLATDIDQAQTDALARKITAAAKLAPEKPSLLTSLVRFLAQPPYAIAFSILFTAAIVLYVTPSSQPDALIAQSEFDNWMFAQVVAEAVSEEAQSEWGFMDLVELEVDVES